MNPNPSPEAKPYRFRRRVIPVAVGTVLLVSVTVKPVRAGIADLLGGSIFGDIYSTLVSFFPEIVAVDNGFPYWKTRLTIPVPAFPFSSPRLPNRVGVLRRRTFSAVAVA